MGANALKPAEIVSASRKLGADDAKALLRGKKRLIVAKGKAWQEVKLPSADAGATVELMLGPTGNLRAPTAVAGDTVIVGFNDEAWESVFGR